jgi:hypothetical protein
VGTDAGREALERNLAHHVPAAAAAVTGDAIAAEQVEAAATATPELVNVDAGADA